MRHLADLVIVDGNVVGNTALKALCGASGSTVLPKGTTPTDVCPDCAALAGVKR